MFFPVVSSIGSSIIATFLIFSDTFVNFAKTPCDFFLCIVIYIRLA